MSLQYIIDPKTNTKHSIYSTTGKLLLKKYISTFTNGGMENEDTQMLINEPILHKKYNIDLNNKIGKGVYAVIDNPNLVCKIGNVTNNEVEIQNKASKLGISPAIIDFGKYNGEHFVIMEKIEGRTVSNLYDKKIKSVVDLKKELYPIYKILNASDICHYDLYGDNIILGRNLNKSKTEPERYWIIDWGQSWVKDPKTNTTIIPCPHNKKVHKSKCPEHCLFSPGIGIDSIKGNGTCYNKICNDNYLDAHPSSRDSKGKEDISWKINITDKSSDAKRLEVLPRQ